MTSRSSQIYQERLRYDFLGISSAHLAWPSPYSEFRNETLRQRKKELVYVLDLEVKGFVLWHLESLSARLKPYKGLLLSHGGSFSEALEGEPGEAQFLPSRMSKRSRRQPTSYSFTSKCLSGKISHPSTSMRELSFLFPL